MVDPALTFNSTSDAIAAREKLIHNGVLCYLGKRRITYRTGNLQLGKHRDRKLHRPYTHCALGMIRQLANGQIAVSFNMLHLSDAKTVSAQWTLIPIVQVYS